MPRRREAEKREILPDPKYNNKMITRFMNCLMVDGKKSVAESVFYGALDQVASKIKDTEAVEVFKGAIENVKPVVEVKSRRVGGANYQVPIDVRQDRRVALALRWIINAARARNERTMKDRLAGELMDAFKKVGAAVKKREDTHRMAEANKAFAHYRW